MICTKVFIYVGVLLHYIEIELIPKLQQNVSHTTIS